MEYVVTLSLNKKEIKAINKVLYNKRDCKFWERENYCHIKMRMGKFSGGISCEEICEFFEPREERNEEKA